MSNRISLMTAVAMTAQSIFSQVAFANDYRFMPENFEENSKACFAKIENGQGPNDGVLEVAESNGLKCEHIKDNSWCSVETLEMDKLGIVPKVSLNWSDEGMTFMSVEDSNHFVDYRTFYNLRLAYLNVYGAYTNGPRPLLFSTSNRGGSTINLESVHTPDLPERDQKSLESLLKWAPCRALTS